MIGIPNSCFSLLFIEQDLVNITQETTVDFKLQKDDTSFLVSGSWLTMKYTLEYIDKTHNEYFNKTIELELITFGTNDRSIYEDLTGFIGIGPCPTSLHEYSFSHQLSLINQTKCENMNVTCLPDIEFDPS